MSVPAHIAGFQTWIKLGRSVRKDEKAIRILAPITVKHRDTPSSDNADERRVFFSSQRSSLTSPRPTRSPESIRRRCSRPESR